MAKNDNHGTMVEQNGKKSVNSYYTPVGSCEEKRGEWGHGSHPDQKNNYMGKLASSSLQTMLMLPVRQQPLVAIVIF